MLPNTSVVFVNETGTNNISLVLTNAAFTSRPINFTCYSSLGSASMIITSEYCIMLLVSNNLIIITMMSVNYICIDGLSP